MRLLLSFLAIFAIAACGYRSASPQAGEAASGSAFSFVVIGDTPYSSMDIEMLDRAVAAIKTGDYPFIIHIGDYKGGGAPCTPDHDARHAALLERLEPTPVFYTPGDNEWTDCDRFEDEATGVRYSDLDRLDLVRGTFFAAPPPDRFGAMRQSALIENSAWSYRDILFATLHVVGTNNGRDWVTGDPLARAQAAADARDRANLEWVTVLFARAERDRAAAVVIAMQADMTDTQGKPAGVMCASVAASDDHACDAFIFLRTAIKELATAFGGPVLIIHGDTAPFTLNQQFAGAEAANLWRLNAAGDAGVGVTGFPYGKRDVTVVTIDPDRALPFSARGLLGNEAPRSR